MSYILIEDMSNLLNISTKLLSKMQDAIMYSINDAVKETVVKNDNICEGDVGIGDLVIGLYDNDLKFKFIPNAKLRESIISTVKNEENMLEIKLEESLANKLEKVYKEII